MIVVVDSRRPSSLGVDANLRLEAFVGNRSSFVGGRCADCTALLVEIEWTCRWGKKKERLSFFYVHKIKID